MKTAAADVGIQVTTYRLVIAQRTEKMAGVEAMWDAANYPSKQLYSVEDAIRLDRRRYGNEAKWNGERTVH